MDLTVQSTNVDAQKIYSTTFEIYKMIVAVFSVINQADKIRFFEIIFLVVNISLNMIFGMFFFILSNIDIDFLNKKL